MNEDYKKMYIDTRLFIDKFLILSCLPTIGFVITSTFYNAILTKIEAGTILGFMFFSAVSLISSIHFSCRFFIKGDDKYIDRVEALSLLGILYYVIGFVIFILFLFI